MIKELDEDREEFQDPGVEFAIAGAVRECSGLEILLEIVQVCFHFVCCNPYNLAVQFGNVAGWNLL